jgi:hypothetical protein
MVEIVPVIVPVIVLVVEIAPVIVPVIVLVVEIALVIVVVVALHLVSLVIRLVSNMYLKLFQLVLYH